ncbi:S8 family serine peptidase [Priestia sp. GS2]|uniref:S8 family serine peptidase n=1 Tax=Priestia sp. GS2 TaxID=3117403 RepID=UPI002ED9C991
MKAKKHLLKCALVAGVIISTSTPYAALAKEPSITMSEAEQVLNNLSKEQREALQQLEIGPGFIISSDINTTTPENVEIIVEFKQDPAKVEVKKQMLNQKKISLGTAKQRVEQSHKEFKTYIDQLKTKKKKAVYDPSKINVKHEYKNAFNGVAMSLPGTAVEELLNSGEVKRIWSNVQIQLELPKSKGEKATPKMIDSIPQIGVDKLHDEGITGQGIKVGVLDTGIDYTHPDLSDSYKGYRSAEGSDGKGVNPSSVKGWDFINNDADPMETTHKDWKATSSPEFNASGNAYYTSHGTHVSGTIAAQKDNKVDYAVKGVAPDVELYAYKVLGPYGSGATEGVLAGIDKAVADGMDVINLSLGANVNDPLYPTSVAINNAMLSGVVSVVAAGNTGPSEKTVNSPGTSAFGITVGASDAAISIPTFSVTAGNKTIESMKLLGKHFNDSLREFEGRTYPIASVGLGKPEDFNGKDLNGKIALIQRGELTFEAKIQNAKKAGATAVIIYNNEEGDIPSYMGESTKYIPTFQLTKTDGEQLKNEESITFNTLSSVKTGGDSLASFSSRGPVNSNDDIKPDIVAPGVSIFSTYPEFMNHPQDGEDFTTAYARLNGTSMATPHVAGVVALILQKNPNVDPFEMKAMLMNTAEDLKSNYSVHEVGAGRIDAYQAVHSDISFKVLNRTDDIQNGEYVEIDNLTGSINYESHYLTGSPINENRLIKIINKGREAKSFQVNVEYHKAGTGIQDGITNKIKVNVPQQLHLDPESTQEISAEITVPSDAKPGRYEGYIHIVNEKDEKDHYQIPFAIRVVEKGIAVAEPLVPSVTNNTPFHQYYTPGTHIVFKLNSPMEHFDIVMRDKKTGQAVGVIGSYDGKGAIPDKEYLIYFGHRGLVYPFTGDKKQPIGDYIQKVPEGEYVIEFIGRDKDGKTYSKESVGVIDNTPPKIDLALEPGPIEVTKDMLSEEDGYYGLWVHGTVKDNTVDLLKQRGFKYTQKTNSVAYYESGPPFIRGFLQIEDNGETKFGVLPEEYEKKPYELRLFPWDMATAADYHYSPRYIFMNEGTEYAGGYFNKEKVQLNDEATLTVSLNNVKEFMAGSLKIDNNYVLQFKEVKVNKEFQELANKYGAEVKLDEPKVSESSVQVGASLVKDGFNGISGDTPFLDVTFKLINDTEVSKNTGAQLTNLSYKKAGKTEDISIPAYSFKNMEVISTHSRFTGNFAPEAFLTPEGYSNNKYDFTKINANIYAKNSKDEVFEAKLDKRGGYEFIVPADKDAYKIYAKVPGHLTQSMHVMGSIEEEGEYRGIYWRQNPGKNLVGDVTGDEVIDIRDVKEAVEDYGKQGGKADLNQDNTVNETDIRLIEQNFLTKGQLAGKGNNPKETIGKKDLAYYLKEVGLTPKN